MSVLPPGFEQLEPFVTNWSRDTAAARALARSNATPEELTAFYSVGKDLVAPALAELDKKALKDFDASERRLMNLLLSFGHVALAVEAQGDDEPRHAQSRAHLRITRAPGDKWDGQDG